MDRATLASDGGTSVVSPLGLAEMAATVDRGSVHGRPEADVVAGLRSMMLTAVSAGTASGLSLPIGTYAKTGTAIFVDAPPPRTVYAWLVGYRADIAFTVLVIGGTEGGPIAGPIAARFLAATRRP